VVLMMSAMSLGMTGCATAGGKTVHSIVLENGGAEEVYEVQVFYGDLKFPLEPRPVLRGGREYNDRLEMPEEATVMWRTKDQQSHKVVMPIRRHVADAASFGGKIEFQINGATLQVFVARRTPRYTFERQQIY
jgi:hypothetical protein